MQINVNGNILEAKGFTNLDVFSYLSSMRENWYEVHPPDYYNDYSKVWRPNFQNPRYLAIKDMVHIGKEVLYARWLFDRIEISRSELNNSIHRKTYDSHTKRYKTHNGSFKRWHIANEYFLNKSSLSQIVNGILLTENTVADTMASVNIKRDGMDLFSHPIKGMKTKFELEPFILGGYQLVHPLDIYECCKESGIPILQWSEIPLPKRAVYMGLYRMSVARSSHISDAQVKESNSK